MIQEHKEQNPYLYSKAMGEWNCIGATSSYAYTNDNAMGRVVSIGFHPSDPNIFFVGSVSGGLWKTSDGGSTFLPVTDNLGKSAVEQIYIPDDFATSNSMFILMGNWTEGSIQGHYGHAFVLHRLYKSTD
jgi:hypothetical protein